MVCHFKKKHQKIHKQNYILSVGRLEWGKGVDQLIHAFALIADTIPKTRLIIIGRDTQSLITGRWLSMRNYLLSIIKLYKLQNRIVLHRQIANHAMPDYYRSCVCYVTASSGYENQPMSLLDAVAASKAIVAFKAVGIAEVITHRSNGYLAKAGDIKKLGQYIQTVISQPEIRKTFERKNDIIRHKYDIRRTSRLTTRHFSRLLDQYDSPAA